MPPPTVLSPNFLSLFPLVAYVLEIATTPHSNVLSLPIPCIVYLSPTAVVLNILLLPPVNLAGLTAPPPPPPAPPASSPPWGGSPRQQKKAGAHPRAHSSTTLTTLTICPLTGLPTLLTLAPPTQFLTTYTNSWTTFPLPATPVIATIHRRNDNVLLVSATTSHLITLSPTPTALLSYTPPPTATFRSLSPTAIILSSITYIIPSTLPISPPLSPKPTSRRKTMLPARKRPSLTHPITPTPALGITYSPVVPPVLEGRNPGQSCCDVTEGGFLKYEGGEYVMKKVAFVREEEGVRAKVMGGEVVTQVREGVMLRPVALRGGVVHYGDPDASDRNVVVVGEAGGGVVKGRWGGRGGKGVVSEDGFKVVRGKVVERLEEEGWGVEGGWVVGRGGVMYGDGGTKMGGGREEFVTMEEDSAGLWVVWGGVVEWFGMDEKNESRTFEVTTVPNGWWVFKDCLMTVTDGVIHYYHRNGARGRIVTIVGGGRVVNCCDDCFAVEGTDGVVRIRGWNLAEVEACMSPYSAVTSNDNYRGVYVPDASLDSNGISGWGKWGFGVTDALLSRVPTDKISAILRPEEGEKLLHIDEKFYANLAPAPTYQAIHYCEDDKSLDVDTLTQFLGLSASVPTREKVERTAVKTLAEILSEGDKEAEEEEEDGKEGWGKCVGKERKREDMLAAYFRFTSLPPPDLSICGTVAFLPLHASTEPSTTVCDEGPSHATLHDVVNCPMAVEGLRGSGIDAGCYFEKDDERGKQTVECWVKVGEKGRVLERWACRTGTDPADVLSTEPANNASLIWALDATETGLTFATKESKITAAVEIAAGKWFHVAVVLSCSTFQTVQVELFVKAKSVGQGEVALPPLPIQKTPTSPRSQLDLFVFVVGRDALAYTDVRFWCAARSADELEEFMAEVLMQAEAKRRKFTVKIASGGGGGKQRVQSMVKLGGLGGGLGKGGGGLEKRRASRATSMGAPPAPLLKGGSPISPRSPRMQMQQEVIAEEEVEPVTVTEETPRCTVDSDPTSFAQLLGSAATKIFLDQPLQPNSNPHVVCGCGKTLIIGKDSSPPTVLPIAGLCGWAGPTADGKQYLMSCSEKKMAVFEVNSKTRIGEIPLTQPLIYGKYLRLGVFLVVNQVGGFLFGVGFARPTLLFKRREGEVIGFVDVAEDLNSAIVCTKEGWGVVRERGAELEAWEGGGKQGRLVDGRVYSCSGGKLVVLKLGGGKVAEAAVEGEGEGEVDAVRVEAGGVLVVVSRGTEGAAFRDRGEGGLERIRTWTAEEGAREGVCVSTSGEIVGRGADRYWRVKLPN